MLFFLSPRYKIAWSKNCSNRMHSHGSVGCCDMLNFLQGHVGPSLSIEILYIPILSVLMGRVFHRRIVQSCRCYLFGMVWGSQIPRANLPLNKMPPPVWHWIPGPLLLNLDRWCPLYPSLSTSTIVAPLHIFLPLHCESVTVAVGAMHWWRQGGRPRPTSLTLQN